MRSYFNPKNTQGWISVKDGLPGNLSEVLVILDKPLEYAESDVAIAWCGNDNKWRIEAVMYGDHGRGHYQSMYLKDKTGDYFDNKVLYWRSIFDEVPVRKNIKRSRTKAGLQNVHGVIDTTNTKRWTFLGELGKEHLDFRLKKKDTEYVFSRKYTKELDKFIKAVCAEPNNISHLKLFISLDEDKTLYYTIKDVKVCPEENVIEIITSKQKL